MTNGISGSETSSIAEYVAGESLVAMVREDLMLKRLSIQGCREIIKYVCNQDIRTCHGLKEILAVKGQRASDNSRRISESHR